MPQIPLPILGAVVVGGVALIVTLARLLGGAQTARLVSEGDARARFTRDHPASHPQAVHLSRDGRAALLELEGGSLAALFVVGAHTSTRLLSRTTLRRARARDGSLELRLRDLGAPRIRLQLDEPELARLLARLETFHA